MKKKNSRISFIINLAATVRPELIFQSLTFFRSFSTARALSKNVRNLKEKFSTRLRQFWMAENSLHWNHHLSTTTRLFHNIFNISRELKIIIYPSSSAIFIIMKWKFIQRCIIILFLSEFWNFSFALTLAFKFCIDPSEGFWWLDSCTWWSESVEIKQESWATLYKKCTLFHNWMAEFTWMIRAAEENVHSSNRVNLDERVEKAFHCRTT